jgi:hypothetical protein
MNSKGLARHYGALTPWERLPLILAASARGDEAERDRLGRSAPRQVYVLPDYHGLEEGLLLLSLFHVLDLLHFTAIYRHAEALAEQDAWLAQDGGEDDTQMSRSLGIARMAAYLLTCHFNGWRHFCAETNLDGELLLREIPGHATASRCGSCCACSGLPRSWENVDGSMAVAWASSVGSWSGPLRGCTPSGGCGAATIASRRSKRLSSG